MRVIHAIASAIYQGRVDANLSTGDVLIIIRDAYSAGDGSVLILGNKGVGPINWMPGGSEIYESDNYILAEHQSRGERLEIFIAERLHEYEAPMTLVGELVKAGAEKEFADLLADRLWLIAPNLELIGREIRTSAGPVDILTVDQKKRPVIIEVKRRRVTLSDVYQLQRYLDNVQSIKMFKRFKRASGYLVGPVLTKNAGVAIKNHSAIDFVRISYQNLLDA